jgi:hypothetical protein
MGRGIARTVEARGGQPPLPHETRALNWSQREDHDGKGGDTALGARRSAMGARERRVRATETEVGVRDSEHGVRDSVIVVIDNGHGATDSVLAVADNEGR